MSKLTHFDADGNAIDGGEADGLIDLMTVAMHELGHVLGFDHTSDDSFMSAMLDPSERLGIIDEAANTNTPSSGNDDTSEIRH